MSEGWYSQLYLLVEWESGPRLAVNVLQAGHWIGAQWTASWGLAPGEAPARIFIVPGPVFHLNKFTQNLKCCIPFLLLVPVSMGHHLKIGLPFLHHSLCFFKGFQELIRYSGVEAVWLGALLQEGLSFMKPWFPAFLEGDNGNDLRQCRGMDLSKGKSPVFFLLTTVAHRDKENV